MDNSSINDDFTSLNLPSFRSFSVLDLRRDIAEVIVIACDDVPRRLQRRRREDVFERMLDRTTRAPLLVCLSPSTRSHFESRIVRGLHAIEIEIVS